MKFFNKQTALHLAATKLINQANKFDKLREIANRNSYSAKVDRLYKKINEQYEFWNKKKPTEKLLDLKKDLNFIQSQLGKDNFDKEKIDLLVKKYG